MVEIVDLAAHRDTNSRNEMLGLLAAVTERVRSGEVTAIVILQTTESQITDISAAGLCCSHNMLGLLHSMAVQIANHINDTAQDVEA